ncbi:MAG: family rane protein [Cohnella sp.]|nr:family rane protein [Cohnella sp.]
MLWTVFVVILLLWVLGFSFHIAGGLIHILLILALISLIYNLFAGRRNRL